MRITGGILSGQRRDGQLDFWQGVVNKLRLTLGSPRVLNNDVWRFYADLVNAFGMTEEIPPDAGSHIGVGSALASDSISMKKFKHIEVYKNELEYLAAEEIASLRGRFYPAI